MPRRFAPTFSRRRLSLALACLCVAGSAAAQGAAGYPARPITIVTGYAPGGPVDTVARLVAEGIRGPLGVPVLVETRAGAAGSIAAEAVARSTPDGYTALVTSLNHITNAVLNPAQKFDTEKAFAPVALLSYAPHSLIVAKDSPFKTYQDFLAAARAKPGKLTVSNSGNGGSPHLVAELFQLRTGVKLVHVAYKGAAPAVADLMGGHVDASFQTLGSVRGQLDSGQVRALAIASDARSSALPDTPTFKELGVDGLVLDSWYGVLLPAGTPAAVVERLHKAIADLAATPAFAAKIRSAGMEPIAGSTPASYKARIGQEIKLVRDITDKAGIKLD